MEDTEGKKKADFQVEVDTRACQTSKDAPKVSLDTCPLLPAPFLLSMGRVDEEVFSQAKLGVACLWQAQASISHTLKQK